MTSSRAIKPPIVVSEHGDISIFDSTESAEGYMEVPDVENAEFELFDSQGLVLNARVETANTRILGVFDKKIVKISATPGADENPERLRQLLTKYLTNSGTALGPHSSGDLSELIGKAR